MRFSVVQGGLSDEVSGVRGDGASAEAVGDASKTPKKGSRAAPAKSRTAAASRAGGAPATSHTDAADTGNGSGSGNGSGGSGPGNGPGGGNGLPPVGFTCRGPELREFLGVSDTTLQKLKKKGVVISAGRSQYDFRASVSGYIAHLRAVASQHQSGSDDDLVAARTRATTAQAEKAELDLAVKRGTVIPADVVRLEWVKFAKTVRSAILTLPAQLAMGLPKLTGAEKAEIKRICRECLDTLANGGAEDEKSTPKPRKPPAKAKTAVKKGKKT